MFRVVRGALNNFIDGLMSGHNGEGASRSVGYHPKYDYSRPHILDLRADEVLSTADKTVRPILTPKNIDLIPLHAGYAEVINAGKSELNEDQVACGCYSVDPLIRQSPDRKQHRDNTRTEFTYFAIFDGHAGVDAAVAAAQGLHKHIQIRLCEAIRNMTAETRITGPAVYPVELPVSPDELIIGALEAAFTAMDEEIGRDIEQNRAVGGCAVIVAVIYHGKLYVANAGDCRAVLVSSRTGCRQLSFDLTPETERQRLQTVASLCTQKAVHDEFTPLQFRRRLTKKDLGTRVLHRSSLTNGWMYKTVEREDLLCPLIAGEGKKARLMGTIGVTRGFGDHDLKVFDTNIAIKPFLSPIPVVTVYELSNLQPDEECVVIMASDGLWDVISSEKSGQIAKESLLKHSSTGSDRYTILAQELIYQARGMLSSDRGWLTSVDGVDKAASLDDISCFVIPLHTPSHEPAA